MCRVAYTDIAIPITKSTAAPSHFAVLAVALSSGTSVLPLSTASKAAYTHTAMQPADTDSKSLIP